MGPCVTDKVNGDKYNSKNRIFSPGGSSDQNISHNAPGKKGVSSFHMGLSDGYPTQQAKLGPLVDYGSPLGGIGMV